MELFFDTETSDKIDFKSKQHYSSDKFPWCVQIGIIAAVDGIAYGEVNLIIKADGRKISDGAQRVHNISVEDSEKFGVSEELVAKIFMALYHSADLVVCHNYQFDSNIIASLLYRQGYGMDASKIVGSEKGFCTMLSTTDYCKLPGKYGFKWPTLKELHYHLFNEGFEGAHDAMFDIKATMRCFYELKKIGWIR